MLLSTKMCPDDDNDNDGDGDDDEKLEDHGL